MSLRLLLLVFRFAPLTEDMSRLKIPCPSREWVHRVRSKTEFPGLKCDACWDLVSKEFTWGVRTLATTPRVTANRARAATTASSNEQSWAGGYMLVHQANPECAWLHVWCQIQNMTVAVLTSPWRGEFWTPFSALVL